MPCLTVAEAKELAHYVKHSHARVFNAVPLGKWLTVISRANGFRDWNAMSALAPKTPDTALDTWGYSALGFAVVCVPEREASYHVIHDRSSAPNTEQVAEKLAQSIASGAEHRFTGASLKFSQLDPAESDEETVGLFFKKGRKHSAALPPVQVTLAAGKVTIWLWWLRQNYLLREGCPSGAQSFAFFELSDQSTTWSGNCTTSHFLHALTEKALPKRNCYYCTELPNERNTYRLILVQEGSRDGQATQYVYDDHASAIKHQKALNSSLGLSQRDAQTISAIFAQYDPYYEEEYFDDYSHNND